MLWLLLTSSLFTLFLCLKAYSFFFSFFDMATFAQCTNQDSNCIYMRKQTCDTRYDMMIPILYGMYAKEGLDQLMCTSNVAGNTQMASLDRQVTQNGLGVNNVMVRENVQ